MRSTRERVAGCEGPRRVGGAGPAGFAPSLPADYDRNYSCPIPRRIRRGSGAVLDLRWGVDNLCIGWGEPSHRPRIAPQTFTLEHEDRIRTPMHAASGARGPGHPRRRVPRPVGTERDLDTTARGPHVGASPTAGGRRSGSEASNADDQITGTLPTRYGPTPAPPILEPGTGLPVSLLPLAAPHLLDPFEALEAKSRRLACVVEASSRRRDVRRFRSQLLLLLLAVSCPPHARPRRRWYVPGATARIGAAGLRRAWRGYHGQDPPTLRTFRSHLSALEQALAIIRSPGDWLPILRDPDHPERRPRYAETIHVLESDSAALWWAGEGRELLAANPGTRCNPDKWAAVFRGWRARSRFCQAHLPLSPPGGMEDPEASRSSSSTGAGAPGPHSRPQPPRASRRRPPPTPGDDHRAGPVSIEELLWGPWGSPPGASKVRGKQEPGSSTFRRRPLAASRTIAKAVRDELEGLELFDVLRGLGLDLRGRNGSAMIANGPRFRASAALFAIALRRGDRIRNSAAWIVRAWRFAEPHELADALEWCGRARP